MRLTKRITRMPLVQRALCAAAAFYIWLVRRTGRWTVVGGEHPARLWDTGRPFILAFWHGRLLMMPYSWRRGVPIHMLISSHPDGQFIARTVDHFGIGWIAGSSTHGGSAALRAMVKALKSGACVGITPDGPRGPRMRAGGGAVAAARLAGVPILPATFAARPRWLVPSWDRFVVALPFARGVFVWGEPLHVPTDADSVALDRTRAELEHRLNRIAADADRRLGLEPVAPADGEAP